MDKKILVTAGVFGALAVVFGAFGAHKLKEILEPGSLDNWKTAVSYQFYHTLALLFLYLMPLKNGKSLIYWCFTIGILLFSGSIYLLSTRVITGISLPFLGPLTPVGGLFFIIGWVSLIVTGVKSKNA